MTRRLLLGCGDPEVTARVTSVAAELGDELVRVTTSSAETIEAVSALTPDVLIVAESLGPVPVLDLIRQVSRQDPFTGILLLAAAADQEVYRVAMEAGARSVAPITFTVDDLGQRIDNAANWSRIVRAHLTEQASRSYGTGHVVALAGSKGGVGTTTMAVHLALESAAAGRRVCLVDLDLQNGDVASLLDITHRRDIVDLVAVAEEVTGQALDDALYRHVSGLHVLLAPREGERGEDVAEQVARAVLGAVKSRFDVVFVDVGSVLTPAGAAAVEIADRAVIVGTPDVLSARGARRVVQLWERLQLRREADVVVLLNRVSRNVEVQPDLAARLLKLQMIDTTVPAAFRALEASTNTGDPQRLVDRDVRRALARVAEALGTRSAAVGGTAPGRGGRPALTAGGQGNLQSSAPAGTPGTVLLPATGTGGANSFSAGAAKGAARGAGRGAGVRRRVRRDGGQSSVEFMGLLPVMLVCVFALIQGGLIGFSYVVSGHAASRAARTAVSPLAGYPQIKAAAVDALPPAWQDAVEVTVDGLAGFGPGADPRLGDPDAQVTVTVHTPAVLPVIGTLFGDGPLTARSSAQMRFEGVQQ
jgi:pilus assembly protein CpaE